MHRGVLATNKRSLCNPRLIRQWSAICLWNNQQNLNLLLHENLWLLFLFPKIATESQILFFLKLLCSLLWPQERNLNKAWDLHGSVSMGHCTGVTAWSWYTGKPPSKYFKKMSWRWSRRNECSSVRTLLPHTIDSAVLWSVVVAQLFLGKTRFNYFFIIANFYYTSFGINQ